MQTQNRFRPQKLFENVLVFWGKRKILVIRVQTSNGFLWKKVCETWKKSHQTQILVLNSKWEMRQNRTRKNAQVIFCLRKQRTFLCVVLCTQLFLSSPWQVLVARKKRIAIDHAFVWHYYFSSPPRILCQFYLLADIPAPFPMPRITQLWKGAKPKPASIGPAKPASSGI